MLCYVQLAKHNKELAEQLSPTQVDSHGELQVDAALDYYATHTAQIEIVRHDRTLEQIVFPIPEICEYLTEETRHRVYMTAERDDQNSKVSDFFSRTDSLFAEMKWQKKLRCELLVKLQHFSSILFRVFNLPQLIGGAMGDGYTRYINLYFDKDAADRSYNKTIQRWYNTKKRGTKTTTKQQQKRIHMTYHRVNFASLLMTELGELNHLRIKDSFLQLISLSKACNPVPV